ncbi:hypothetical protein QM616_19125 [Rhodococcus fascians]|uniref:DUF6602 domain-containing protein n=1 Tax=Rhodococcoides fascians TaxID=1828 RepID=UPI0024B81EC3|nr:DUF6602 domain-containing protein [Rhodococcus fascians]MDJ0004840.1 hypothetical protein [Rhodococcus fascians]
MNAPSAPRVAGAQTGTEKPLTRQYDIAAAFRRKQSILLDSHASVRDVISHPTGLGDHSEADWVGVLKGFLPERYIVGPIFAVDADGARSEQIDVAVYDRQYSPLWFGSQGGFNIVPVEAVYAVFEVKPTIDTTYIAAACRKVASVRQLRRTSAPIKHAGGAFSATSPTSKHIIGGLLAAKASWVDRAATIAKLEEHLPAIGLDGSLDIGIAVDTIAFDYTPAPTKLGSRQGEIPLEFSAETDQLIHFGIRLFRQLQQLGTVLAIDMGDYESALARQ